MSQQYQYPVFNNITKNSHLFPVLDHARCSYHKAPLSLVDFCVTNTCAGLIKRIRRKTIYDPDHPIYNELKQGFYQDAIYYQMKAFSDLYSRIWLIIEVEEGIEVFDATFTSETWNKARLMLEMEYNIHVQFTRTVLETINFIYSLWDQAKRDPKYLPPVNLEPKPKEVPDLQLFFLSGLPQTGDIRGRTLLKELHNPLEVIKWIVAPTFEIKGIGSNYLELNRKILTQQYPP